MMFFKKEYISWDDYSARIGFMEDFFWQQSVRSENMRNI